MVEMSECSFILDNLPLTLTAPRPSKYQSLNNTEDIAPKCPS